MDLTCNEKFVYQKIKRKYVKDLYPNIDPDIWFNKFPTQISLLYDESYQESFSTSKKAKKNHIPKSFS